MAEKRLSARRRSAGEWQAVLWKLAESGEDVDQFCRPQGIYPPTLRWWQWRLKGQGRSPEQPRSATTELVVPSGPEFTELRVVSAPGRPESAVAHFELRWRDGLTLAIPQAFDREALCRLLAALEVAGC